MQCSNQVGYKQNETFFFQILNGCCRINVSKYVTTPEPMQHRTKHNRYIQPYWCSTDRFKYSFFVRCIDEWNKLPARVVNSEDLMSFAKELELVYACN